MQFFSVVLGMNNFSQIEPNWNFDERKLLRSCWKIRSSCHNIMKHGLTVMMLELTIGCTDGGILNCQEQNNFGKSSRIMKVMLAVLFTFYGLVHDKFFRQGQTIERSTTSEFYAICLNQFSKNWENTSMPLHHDNAPSQISLVHIHQTSRLATFSVTKLNDRCFAIIDKIERASSIETLMLRNK